MLEETCKILQELAIAEEWDPVDAMVQEVCNDEGMVDHAYNVWMYHENVNVRDLSGTVMEAAEIPEEKFAGMRKNIADAMGKESKNYAKFRLACALAKHDPRQYVERTIDVLQDFMEDKDQDVRETARAYLGDLDFEGVD